MKAVQCSIHGLQFGHSFYSDVCNSCCIIDIVEVKLHSTEPSAVEAVRETLRQLPMGGGELIEFGGHLYVKDGFIAFACENQGYVKEVLR